ncbi:MAG: glycosyltransferase family 1 protein [Bacteroidales bacterium]
MNIAVNTRLLIKNKLEGIGWVAFETLKRITKEHKEHTFFFIFDRPFDDSFIFSGNIEPVVAHPQARHPFLYYLWFEHTIPKVLKNIKADMFLSPDAYLSLSSDIRSLAVFHDLNFEHYPEDLPFLERHYYRHFFPRYARKADRIVTVSKFSRRDIINQYSIPGDKIDVVYNGANEVFTPLDEKTEEAVRNQYTEGKPYFLFVGALHPRKNLARLFTAYDQFRKNSHKEIKLLIVGNKKWWTREIKRSFGSMSFKNDVVFSGRLTSEELHRVMASAMALTYISYFEGFGIPIVEAFYCDTPVITSNVTSMPEVAGDAAILTNPFSIGSITEAMMDLAENPGLQQELIEKGRERRKLFTWKNTAEQLWQSIEKVLNT